MSGDILNTWLAWCRRLKRDRAAITIYADGSGSFDENDLYGPTHEFDSPRELLEILATIEPQ